MTKVHVQVTATCEDCGQVLTWVPYSAVAMAKAATRGLTSSERRITLPEQMTNHQCVRDLVLRDQQWTETCIRPPHRAGPCNGYPRPDCPGYDSWQDGLQASAERRAD